MSYHERLRSQIIRRARELGAGDYEALAASTGPGAFEGCYDLQLAAAIEVIHGHGFSDDQGGSVEFGRHGVRVEHWVLWTDSNGFRTLEEFDTPALAEFAIAEEDQTQGGAED